QQDHRGGHANVERDRAREPFALLPHVEEEVLRDVALDPFGQAGGRLRDRRHRQLPLQISFPVRAHAGCSSSSDVSRIENALCSRLRMATVVISSIFAISFTARPPQKCAVTVNRKSSGRRSTAARSRSASSRSLSTW